MSCMSGTAARGKPTTSGTIAAQGTLGVDDSTETLER